MTFDHKRFSQSILALLDRPGKEVESIAFVMTLAQMNARAFMEPQACRKVMKWIRDRLDDKGLTCLGLELLGVLAAVDVKLTAPLMRAGICDVLMEALRMYASVEPIVEKGINIMALLCDDSIGNNVAAFVQVGACRAVLDALNRFPDTQTIQFAGLWAISLFVKVKNKFSQLGARFARNDTAHELWDGGACDIAINAITRFVQDEKLCTNAFVIINHFASEISQAAVAHKGACEAILASLAAPRESVFKEAAWALHRHLDCTRAMITDHDACAIFRDIMVRHPDQCGDVIVVLLRMLAKFPDMVKEAILRSDIDAVLRGHKEEDNAGWQWGRVLLYCIGDNIEPSIYTAAIKSILDRDVDKMMECDVLLTAIRDVVWNDEEMAVVAYHNGMVDILFDFAMALVEDAEDSADEEFQETNAYNATSLAMYVKAVSK